jgi:hypothetical protein
MCDGAAAALRADDDVAAALDVFGGEIVDEIRAEDGAVDDEESGALSAGHLAGDAKHAG